MVQLGILNIQTSNLALFIPNFTPILGIVFQILRLMGNKTNVTN
jgi:hypothetical protein